ncbi:MAG: hypothetical protein R3A51_23630, partial [Nannocystaceae bacterium]
MKRTDPATLEEQLTDEQRGRLEAGHHAAVARELADAGQHALAGWVLEQIWDFAAALDHYERAGRPLDALRAALELDHPGRLDRVIAALERRISGEPALLEAARAMLERRGRHMEVARLLARGQDDPKDRAEALRRAGSPLEAARVLADAGQLREALELLPLSTEAAGRSSSSSRAPVHALAARLCWELGDVEAAARHAQLALRSGIVEDQRPALVRLMARALVALGHDIAAEVALQGLADGREGEAAGEVPVRGRYHLRETLTACYAGAAYSATDRVTLQEVEVHLLLAEYGESGQADDPGVTRVLDAFARRAEAAARIGHPAIRPILRFDAEAGLLVLPRAEGPTLRSLIRAPGMASAPTRARALVTFLLEGLVAAHARGLVHGSLLPGQIVCDAAGRPLLGPFGAEQLAGLVATRTGTLEELMTV